HPNVVRFFDDFTLDGKLYVVMQYCEGGDLYSHIRAKVLEESEIWRLFGQLVSAVWHLHEHLILHRDIKTKVWDRSPFNKNADQLLVHRSPKNIFMDRGKKIIKLGDFGIARRLPSVSDLAQTAIGTPNYMSPEVAAGRSYSWKSDVWAVGLVVAHRLFVVFFSSLFFTD
ncbi:protein kinase, partial [Zopfochytrium polystomum]